MNRVRHTSRLNYLIDVGRVISSVRCPIPVREHPLLMIPAIRSSLKNSMHPISHIDKACRSRLPPPQLNRLALQVDAVPFKPGDLVVSGSSVEQHDNNIVNLVLPVSGPGGMRLSCQQMAEQSVLVILG